MKGSDTIYGGNESTDTGSDTVNYSSGSKIDVDLEKAINALDNFENVKVIDDIDNNKYPMPIDSTGTDLTYVGRVRKDIYNSKILHLWCVADQVRVGAATNAVRIAQKFIETYEDR